MAGAKEMVDALVRRRRSGMAATVALGGLALIAGLAARSRSGQEAASTQPTATCASPGRCRRRWSATATGRPRRGGSSAPG